MKQQKSLVLSCDQDQTHYCHPLFLLEGNEFNIAYMAASWFTSWEFMYYVFCLLYGSLPPFITAKVPAKYRPHILTRTINFSKIWNCLLCFISSNHCSWEQCSKDLIISYKYYPFSYRSSAHLLVVSS